MGLALAETKTQSGEKDTILDGRIYFFARLERQLITDKTAIMVFSQQRKQFKTLPSGFKMLFLWDMGQ